MHQNYSCFRPFSFDQLSNFTIVWQFVTAQWKVKDITRVDLWHGGIICLNFGFIIDSTGRLFILLIFLVLKNWIITQCTSDRCEPFLFFFFSALACFFFAFSAFLPTRSKSTARKPDSTWRAGTPVIWVADSIKYLTVSGITLSDWGSKRPISSRARK